MTDSKREAREIEEQAQYAIDHLRDTAQTLRSAAPNATWHYEALEKAADTLESYDSLLKENQELREQYAYLKTEAEKRIDEKDAEITRLRETLNEIADVTSAFKNEPERLVSYCDFELREIARKALARADGNEGV